MAYNKWCHFTHPVYCRLFIKCFINSADVSVIVISSEKFAQTVKTGCNVTVFDALQLRVYMLHGIFGIVVVDPSVV